MAQIPLLTLLHISDLHFGDLDPRSGASTLDALTLRYWRVNRQFDGYLGHTWRALRALSVLYKAVKRRLAPGEKLHVLVSGDLTTTGSGRQFATVLQFLRGRLEDAAAPPIGLGMTPKDYTIIPGNHDHWAGRRFPLGGPTPDFGRVFPLPYPRSEVKIQLGSICTLAIAEIDSDDEVSPWSTNRLLARGSFVQQCLALRRILGSAPSSELRILLVHHSAIDRGEPSPTLKIDTASNTALNTLIAAANIKLTLTGHWHFYDCVFPNFASASREARCGSTTVCDFYDGRILYTNSAFVHRLSYDGKVIQWDTEIWSRPILLTGADQVPLGTRFERKDTVHFGPPRP